MAEILAVKTQVAFNPKTGFYNIYKLQTSSGDLKVSELKFIKPFCDVLENVYIYPCSSVCDNFGSKLCTKETIYLTKQKCKGNFFIISKENLAVNSR